MFVLHLYLVTKYPLLKLLSTYAPKPPRPPHCPWAPKTHTYNHHKNDDDQTSQTPETPSTPTTFCGDNNPWTVLHGDSSLQLSAQTKDGLHIQLVLHL
uniref:Protein E4 n=1 Tax=Human papillomavirus 52 TaxID=10618 RepID=A0A7G2A8N6_HPV52|nr:early protein E4 [human papillomavirus 52]